jgi:hypothetical protein
LGGINTRISTLKLSSDSSWRHVQLLIWYENYNTSFLVLEEEWGIMVMTVTVAMIIIYQLLPPGQAVFYKHSHF